jgi:Ni2+-binding GTPase involved in maturation of urease and hydrogenase
MKVVIAGGTLGSGKTSVLIHVLGVLRSRRCTAGVFKIDTRSNADSEVYQKHSIAAVSHLTGPMCPDHEAMLAFKRAWQWAKENDLDVLIIETAGLCFRCAPFLERALAVCMISGLMNIGTPEKLGPLLTRADCIVLTRAEGISHAERQIFLEELRSINRTATLTHANGLTGEGTSILTGMIMDSPDIRLTGTERLRSSLPRGYCHLCQE